MDIEESNIIKLSDEAFMAVFYQAYISNMSAKMLQNTKEIMISDEIIKECMNTNPQLCDKILTMKNRPLGRI